ncbi:MAG TPA: hypothetical protein VGG73_20915 [Vicinamibacterales bacterium]|jgi:hypothetical protein
MRRFAFGLLGTILGYLIGAFGGGFAITMLSSNQHDRSVEAVMTGAFVIGPLGALIGLVTGVMSGAPRKSGNHDG